MKLLVSLIALLSFTLSSFAATPKYPFPTNVTYKYGIMPKGIDATKVQQAYESFMTLYKEQGDLARIQWDTPTYTVSEGIGYGMLILVYMDNDKNKTQEKFNKLWNYYKKFSGSVGGLMSWKIKEFTGPEGMNDKNAATDAELDVAIALLQAYKQWGEETYLTDAKALVDKISKQEITTDGYIKPGDSWDSQFNPSYFSTGALEVFKQAGTFDWAKVITNAYDLLKKASNASTGLPPDWCTKQGGAISGRSDYKYDAARTPWRIAWAYSWYGHSEAKDFCTKIASWISTKTSNDPGKIVDGYKLDGTETSEYNNSTFVGPFTCAGMVDASHQAWLDKGYALLTQLQEDVYYQMSVRMLTMLYLSGNMPNLWDFPGVAVAPQHAGAVSSQSQHLTLTSLGASTLSFTTATSGSATISIFNAAGKSVHSTSKHFSAGNNTVELNTLLGNGMYVVKMQTENGSITDRMVVTR